MSSDMKDARWGLAKHYAGKIGTEIQDFTYDGWEKLLARAQAHLDIFPEDIPYWAEEFREEPENPLSKPQ